jgi:hypothetical protein
MVGMDAEFERGGFFLAGEYRKIAPETPADTGAHPKTIVTKLPES